MPLAILPLERDLRAEPSAAPEKAQEEAREASPEVVELGKDKSKAETEQAQGVKGSGRRKTTASISKKVLGMMKATLEKTRITRSAVKAKESTPVATANIPRQTRSNRAAQTGVDIGVASPAIKKPKVTSPSSSKGKGKRMTELDTAKFMEINFSDAKGKLDHAKLERFQGTFAKREIKPGKLVKIDDLEGVFKHYEAVKDMGVFNFLKLSAPFYPPLIRIFYSNTEHKVKLVDSLTKEH